MSRGRIRGLASEVWWALHLWRKGRKAAASHALWVGWVALRYGRWPSTEEYKAYHRRQA